MVPTSIVCPCQLTLCPSIHRLALRLATLVLLTVAASVGFYNLLPYDLVAHTCSKHLGSISMVQSAAFHSYFIFALLVPSVLLHKSFASLGWTDRCPSTILLLLLLLLVFTEMRRHLVCDFLHRLTFCYYLSTATLGLAR